MFVYGLALYRIDSAKGRIIIYRVTLDIIMDKPILGYGLEGAIPTLSPRIPLIKVLSVFIWQSS